MAEYLSNRGIGRTDPKKRLDAGNRSIGKSPSLALAGNNDHHRNMSLQKISISKLAKYLRLASFFWKQRQFPDRDRMLLLSAVGAFLMRMDHLAAYCRHLILQNNSGHMVGRTESIHKALLMEDMHCLLQNIQKKFPLKRIDFLINGMGYIHSDERKAYFNDEEYAASILGVRQTWLIENFDADGRETGPPSEKI